MDIRMMAFDMDGTLRTGAGFPERNCRALQECQRRGIKLVFCSGREVERLREFAGIVGVDPWLASYNGARIDRPGNGGMVERNVYGPEEAERIYRVLKASGLSVLAFVPGGMYSTNNGACGRWFEPGVFDLAGQRWEVVDDPVRAAGEGLVNVSKFVAMGEKFDPRFDEIRAELADMGLAIAGSSYSNIEIMKHGIDKGYALRRIAGIEGIAPAQIMAFGDQTNDLPMLGWVGWPVGMQSGAEEVKAVARIIAPPAAEAGVGQVIERILEGEFG